METVFRISNEDEAFDALRRLIEGHKDETAYLKEGVFSLELESWPRFMVRIQGKDFNGTIPTRIMPTLLDLQRDVHRVYCWLKYGDTNLRRLNHEERELLELVVRIDKGSSLFETLLDSVLERVFQSAVDKMTPEQLTISIIVIGVSLTSHLAWKAWLNHRRQVIQAESEERRQKDILEQQVVLSRLEQEKLELLAKALELAPQAKPLVEESDVLRDEMVRRLKDEDTLSVTPPEKAAKEVQPVKITGSEAAALTRKPRDRSVERMVSGQFQLRVIDFSQSSGVKAELERLSDGYTFRADIPLGVLGDEQIAALKEGSWEKKPLEMSVLVKELHGHYRSAKVVSVSMPVGQDHAT